MLALIVSTLLTGCVVAEPPYRDGDGSAHRIDRDRDGDGAHNSHDRRPDDLRRY
ncbi:MAG: hypothetical protein ABIS45_17470 [Burkholderiales bacterium]